MTSRPATPALDLATLRAIPAGIWTLGLVSMLMDLSSEMIHAILPLYLVTVVGTSTLVVGIIEGIAEATAAIVKVFSGAFSDWLGRRKGLAVAGYLMAALTKPIFPLAPSVGWLVAARFIDRIGKGVRGAPRDALIADLAPEHLRGASFGLRQALDTIGAVAAPLAAILLMWLTANDFVAVFWVAVVPAFAAVALMFYGLQEPERPAGLRQVTAPLSPKELARLGRRYWLIVTFGVVFTLARFSEAFLVLKAQAAGMPLMLVPVVMVVMSIAYMLTAYPAGVMADNGRRREVLTAGLAALILADLVLALAPGIAGALVGAAIWGLHMGLTQGLLSALVAGSTPPELRGTGFGVFNLASGVALLAASVIAGAAWDAYGPEATFLAGAAFAAIALVGFLWAGDTAEGPVAGGKRP